MAEAEADAPQLVPQDHLPVPIQVLMTLGCIAGTEPVNIKPGKTQPSIASCVGCIFQMSAMHIKFPYTLHLNRPI